MPLSFVAANISVRLPVGLPHSKAFQRLTLNDPNAAIQPLLDLQGARTLVENKAGGLQRITVVSLYEHIIQMNEWLEKYQVTLAL